MRVLIATVTAGGGHLAAAAALEEAWRALRPADTLQHLDLLKLFSPLHRKIVAGGYVTLVERAPEVWGMMFKKTDSLKLVRRLNRLKRLFPSHSRLKFKRFLQQFDPAVVLCTHYLPLEAFDARPARPARHQRRQPPPMSPLLVSIVTDFEAHALWMAPRVDLYCVAAPETKARLVARGAREEDVVPTGIPISLKFSSKVDSKALRASMGLRDDQDMLLVLSGGFGMGPVGQILNELDKIDRAFQTVVVTGRNEALRRDLASQDRKHPTHVLGFASNMHELMAIADLIITKPGGLTSSEALAAARPLFILNPIPGQEAANSDFLLEHGAACKVNRVEDLPFRVDQLLGSKKLAEMSRAAKSLGRPKAALAVCEEVIRRSKLRGIAD